MQRVLGLPPQRGGSLPGSLPRHVSFDSTPKPHANTSPLARFRDDFVPEIPSSAPNAQAVYYGACSVSSDDVPPLPDQIITHPNANVLVMTGCSGWKQRDPFLAYFKIADVGNKWEGAPEVEVMECGLLDIARHIALDPTRKIIWAADDKRAKSYTYDSDGYRPVHTLACQRSGPLAIVDNGARVLRAGAKGVDVWNLDGLPTHGPEGDKHIGKGRINISNTSRDPDDLEDTIERSPGVKRTSSIDFDGSIEKWHLPSWWSTGGSLKAISSGFMARSTVVARDLQDQGKITQRYIGHGGDVHSITSSDADASAFLTSASDGIVRLFDIRQPLPQLSIDSGEGSERTYSSLYVHVDGVPGAWGFSRPYSYHLLTSPQSSSPAAPTKPSPSKSGTRARKSSSTNSPPEITPSTASPGMRRARRSTLQRSATPWIVWGIGMTIARRACATSRSTIGAASHPSPSPRKIRRARVTRWTWMMRKTRKTTVTTVAGPTARRITKITLAILGTAGIIG